MGTCKAVFIKLGICLLIFNMPAVSGGWAAEPATDQAPATLARLSFYVPMERMAEFEAAYQEKVVPILKTHGPVKSAERGRATVAGVFSRLFEVKTPSEIVDRHRALQEDRAWKAVLQELGAAFGSTDNQGPIEHRFGLYSAPAGAGKTVSAGPGKPVPAGPGRGHWRTYDKENGLVHSSVVAILQDRDGYLWFGTGGGGVSRTEVNHAKSNENTRLGSGN